MVHFKDIYGNKEVIRHFQTTLRFGNVSHAYLLSGEDGSGKNMLADAFSAALLCERGDIEPCGVCKSCIQAATGNHPDIIRVTHEKQLISVNDIREQLVSNVGIKPYSSEYKIFIVNDAELMNEAAQNALLKTLEEPPDYAVILLLSASEDMLLQTVRSRCVRLSTRPLTHAEVVDYLTKEQGQPDYFASTAAAFSGGNLGKAIEYVTSTEASERRSKALSLIKDVDDLTLAQIQAELKDIPDRKEFLDLVTLWLRDVLMYKSTGNGKKLVFKNEEHAIEVYAKTRSFEALNRATEAVFTANSQLNSNVTPEVALELLILKLKDRV